MSVFLKPSQDPLVTTHLTCMSAPHVHACKQSQTNRNSYCCILGENSVPLHDVIVPATLGRTTPPFTPLPRPLSPYLGQVLLFLLLAAVPDDLVDAEVGMVPIAEANGRAGPTHLLNGDAVLQVAQASPSILLWKTPGHSQYTTIYQDTR